MADHSLPLVGSSWMVVKALDGKRGWCGVLGIYVAIWKPICSIYLPSCASWASLPIFTPPCNQAEGWINKQNLSGQFYQFLQNKVRDHYFFPSVNLFDVLSRRWGKNRPFCGIFLLCEIGCWCRCPLQDGKINQLLSNFVLFWNRTINFHTHNKELALEYEMIFTTERKKLVLPFFN